MLEQDLERAEERAEHCDLWVTCEHVQCSSPVLLVRVISACNFSQARWFSYYVKQYSSGWRVATWNSFSIVFDRICFHKPTGFDHRMSTIDSKNIAVLIRISNIYCGGGVTKIVEYTYVLELKVDAETLINEF